MTYEYRQGRFTSLLSMVDTVYNERNRQEENVWEGRTLRFEICVKHMLSSITKELQVWVYNVGKMVELLKIVMCILAMTYLNSLKIELQTV